MPTQTFSKYSVKMAALKTGLSPDVIRIWERRYGAVTPLRTASGHRLYSEADIERLRMLRALTLRGRNIGRLASVSTGELAQQIQSGPGLDLVVASSGVRAAGLSAIHEDGSHCSGQTYIQLCLSAIERLDSSVFDDTLLQASSKLGQPEVLDDVIEPLLRGISTLWQTGNLRISHEHFASVGIRNFLTYLARSAGKPAKAPTIVITTPTEQLHEIGALLVMATAASQGWNSLYLGPNLPAAEIALALESSKAKVLALSIVHPESEPRINRDLALLAKILPSGTHVLAGGRAAKSYSRALNRMQAVQITNMAAARSHLEILRQHLAADTQSSLAAPYEILARPNNSVAPELQEAVAL